MNTRTSMDTPSTPANRAWPIDVGILDGGLTTMDARTHHCERTFTIPGEGAIRVWGLSLEDGVDPAFGRKVFFSVAGGLPDPVRFQTISPDIIPEVFPAEAQLVGAARWQGNRDRNRLVYLVLINTGGRSQTVTVSADEVTWTVTPEEVSVAGDIGNEVPVPFRVAIEHVPAGMGPLSMGRASTSADHHVEGPASGQMTTTYTRLCDVRPSPYTRVEQFTLSAENRGSSGGPDVLAIAQSRVHVSPSP
jgi:hypothetical protein